MSAVNTVTKIEAEKLPAGPMVDGKPTVMIPCTCCARTSPVDYEFVENFKIHHLACPDCNAKHKTGMRWDGSQWQAASEVEFVPPEMKRWRAICPPLYQQTDVNHASFPRALFKRHLANWQCGSRSLLLHGDTGTAKSRCMFLLLQRLVLEEKRSVRVFFPEDWSQWVAANCKGDEEALEARRELMGYDIIAFDDLFVEKLTDRAEGQLQGLIDRRVREMRPVIATTMYTGEDLTQMGKFIDSRRGQAVIRRLRESGLCDTVSFVRSPNS